MTRIMFVAETGDSACAHYRAEIPANGLRQLGYDVDIVSIMFEDDNHQLRGVHVTPDDQHVTPLADIVICRRINGPDGELLPSKRMFTDARKTGQVVLFDIDDDPWNLPEHNPAYQNRRPNELALWMRDMSATDGLIVSTDHLRDVAADHLDLPVYVCRNGIDAASYTQRRSAERTPFRLAWIGALNYRQRDLEQIIEPLRNALDEKRDTVELWHLGEVEYDNLHRRLPTIWDVLGFPSTQGFAGPTYFPVDIFSSPWVTIHKLPELLAKVDSVLIPMEQTPFNRSRSNATGLACMAAGLPFVASNLPEYERLWTQGGGYVVPNVDSVWEDAIRLLCEPQYEEARTAIRIGGLSLAHSVYGPKSTAEQYVKVFADFGH